MGHRGSGSLASLIRSVVDYDDIGSGSGYVSSLLSIGGPAPPPPGPSLEDWLDTYKHPLLGRAWEDPSVEPDPAAILWTSIPRAIDAPA